ncbi:MAG TPA: GAF domain-containing sensor histidine kinase [Steroidobacteraceae bacterium]|nr:GAF domain-containing sensor histidine kinase [Steroidobacteraceae bacterium]
MATGSVAGDVAAVSRIGAVPSILQMVCKMTGMRFATIARVTEDTWTACAVRDEIDFGLKVGGELPLKTTICDEIRASGRAIVIDHVSEDPEFHTHHTPKLYGFESYISVPIVRTNGDFFGTLCALDPLPAKVSDPKVIATFELFSQLISLQLDAEERMEKSEAALLDEQQTAELRELFIAVLGHDLRTPLSSVSAGVQALQKMQLTGQATTILERIKRSSDRIARLIENILDFARGRLGGGIPVLKHPDAQLPQALAHVIAELSAIYPERKVDANIHIAKTVTCDSGRLAQLLANLLSNALTYGAADQPVTVVARRDNGTFTLSVTNNGNPIPPETVEQLFQPFARGAGGERRQQGLGLGLYIASQIAQAHGGTLSVESNPAGTTFALSMPAGN